MLWKILSGCSAACLGVALYFAFISKNDIHQEREVEAKAKENSALVKTHKQKADETLAQKNSQIKSLQGDADKLKKEVAEAEADSKTKEDALATAKKSLEETVQQLASVQKQIDDAGDVDKLVAQVKALEDEKKAAEAAVAAEAAKIAALQEKLTGLQQQAEHLRTVEVNSRKGVLEPTFTARVAQAFTDWGFAVLNKGNNGGVIANAELEVKRGRNTVARLKVRNVEQSISVADIVPGSVPQGYSVRSGDTVVPAPPKPDAKPETKTSEPAKGTGTGAPNPTPNAPAPQPASNMTADPFGGSPMPAGGAPAPAPAPAPGAPAKPEADPFATPPAATPPAGAPASGAGTKQSPSTADPFAK